MKKLDKKGFTLAELLIVVAIIAVLVAIAIPVFTARLEQSRETTDIANLRSAYAAAQVAAMNGIGESKVASLSGTTWLFDPNNEYGLYLSASGSASALKGQGTAANGHPDTSTIPNLIKYSGGYDTRGKPIEVKFGKSGLSVVQFSGTPTAAAAADAGGGE